MRDVPMSAHVYRAFPAEQTVEEVLSLSKPKRKGKDKPMDEATREAIRQKIAASMARKAAKVRYNCPACGVLITRVGGILLHMDKCCPDLLTEDIRTEVRSGCVVDWAVPAACELGAAAVD